jgi:hypothetical protein
MIAATTRAARRLLGLPDGQVHIGKGKLEPLSQALADDVERRVRQFSDDDPTGELCTGCVMMALVQTSIELGVRLAPRQFAPTDDEASAAFVASMSDAMAEAALAISDGEWDPQQKDH